MLAEFFNMKDVKWENTEMYDKSLNIQVDSSIGDNMYSSGVQSVARGPNVALGRILYGPWPRS